MNKAKEEEWKKTILLVCAYAYSFDFTIFNVRKNLVRFHDATWRIGSSAIEDSKIKYDLILVLSYSHGIFPHHNGFYRVRIFITRIWIFFTQQISTQSSKFISMNPFLNYIHWNINAPYKCTYIHLTFNSSIMFLIKSCIGFEWIKFHCILFDTKFNLPIWTWIRNINYITLTTTACIGKKWKKLEQKILITLISFMWGCLDRGVKSQGFLININEPQVY